MADLTTAGASAFGATVFVLRFPDAVRHDYESAVHAIRQTFTAAIVSWNVDSPPMAWIDVGLRAHIGERWTAWYVMGEWSPELASGHRRSRNGQSDEDGRVDTDTLVLAHAADALQLRVTMHPAADGAGPALRLLAVTVDQRSKAPFSPSAFERSPAWGTDRDVPARTQRVGSEGGRYGGGGDSWCSPASISMVMAYWARVTRNPRLDISVAEAAAGTYDPDYDGCGNWPFNIAFASRFGLEGWVARLASIGDLEKYIDDDIPVVASIRVAPGDLDGAPYLKTAGHLIVVRGFTEHGDVIVNDPYAEPGSIQRIYKRDQFDRVWQTGSHGAVYLIAPTGRLLAS